jgi:hypothetical protein
MACRAGTLTGMALALAMSWPTAGGSMAEEAPRSTGRPAPAAAPSAEAMAAGMSQFLDRLMQAESGGRDDAANPRSTALGPFQFIETTFLEVVRRHFAAETRSMTPAQILARRTDRAFARRAAEAFTRDNAAALANAGVATSYANLRLAFLVGAGGAIALVTAEPKTPAIRILGTGVVQANPFMAGMSAADLANWSARNLAAGSGGTGRMAAAPATLGASGLGAARLVKAPSAPPRPRINVQCNRGLASCRRWIKLAIGRAATKERIAERRSAGRGRR